MSYLAQYFDAIEINSTFYRIPDAKTTQRWVARVADHPDFRFTAKLWQGFTHEGTASAQDAAAFRRAMAPLQEAGKLGAILMQFPYRFHHTAENRTSVQRLADAFRDYRARPGNPSSLLGFVRRVPRWAGAPRPLRSRGAAALGDPVGPPQGGWHA